MTLQTYWTRSASGPGPATDYGHRPRHRRADRRVHRLRPRSRQRTRSRAPRQFESGVWSGEARLRARQGAVAGRRLIDENAELSPSSNAQRRHAAAGGDAPQSRPELFRYYAGWCTKIDGIARRCRHRRHDRGRLAHAHLHAARALRRGRADLSRGTVRSSISAPSSRRRWRPAAVASSNPLRRHHFRLWC